MKTENMPLTSLMLHEKQAEVTLQSADELPAEWDNFVGDNCYMKRGFLQFIESIDNCSQKYQIFRNEKGEIDTVFMMYVRPDFNLFMFTPIKILLRTNFVYVPLSVTRPGIECHGKTIPNIISYLKKNKGYTIFLNTAPSFELSGFIKAKTFPRCVLKLRWNTFEEYFDSLRSGYRHRYKKAIAKSKKLRFRMLEDNSQFSDTMYSLYEEVYNNSPYKIEKLSKPFFQGSFFKIGVFEMGNEPVGFIQLVENESELIFEFVGFNHKLNKEYDIYISLLMKIVEYGINHRFQHIDFGQTADEAKLKLGCRYEPLFALIRHSNPIVHFLTRIFIGIIQYKPLDENKFHVFKPFIHKPVDKMPAQRIVI